MAGRDARPEFPVGPFYVKGCSLHGFVMFKASPEELYDPINNLQKWPDWALWLCKKENANITFSRNLRGKGAVMEFSLVNGKGELEIIESEQNKLVHTRTSFKHWGGMLHSVYNIKPINIDSTQIQLNR